MNTIEIGDEDIDVEEIMRKIHAGIEKRRESVTGEMNNFIDAPLQGAETGGSNMDHLQQELNCINSDWNTRAEYSISSHRRFIGWLLIKGRQLVHGEVRRYVDLLVGKQIEFNAHLVQFVNRLIPGIEDRLKQMRSEISEEINDRVGHVRADMGTERDDKLGLLKSDINTEMVDKLVLLKSDINTEMDDKLGLLKSDIGTEMDDKLGLLKSDINTEMDDKLGLLKSDIGTEMDDKLGLLKSDIGTERDDKLGLLKSDIGTERDDKLGLLKSDVNAEMDDKLGLLKSDIGTEMDDKVSHVRAEICTEIEGKVNDVVATVNEDIKNKAWLANLLEHRIGKKKDEEIPITGAEEDMNFFVFEEKFRGTREDIKGRQLKFLEYSQGCENVLDIGCGRGEFLEILKENGITAKGIDINEDMVIYCNSKGLNVERTDAIEYLAGLDAKSLDSLFLDQVVEHLAPEYLMKLLSLCYSKLKFGFYIVIETVNPLSLTSFANFYIDLTHKKPIHPEALKFLLESAGFRDVEVTFFSPIPDEYKLKKVEIREDIGEKERRIIETYNYNTNKLNETLFGYQDYAVIGKK